MTENSIRILEKVQSDCLRWIMGAKAYSACDALDIIGNILPIRLRIQELCICEFVRIKRKPNDSRLWNLLCSAKVH